MRPMTVYIIAGLSFRDPENSLSRGITVVLANMLRADGIRVVVASHHEWEEVVADIRSRPANELIFIIGHSLGGSIAPEVARRAGRTIHAIYGFDPAHNPAANVSEYRLTLVPSNVKFASALVEKGAGLGGGAYVAEDPLDDDHPNGATRVRNKEVDFGHGLNDDDLERPLGIREAARILRAA